VFSHQVAGCYSVNLGGNAAPDIIDTWYCGGVKEAWASTLPSGSSASSAARSFYSTGDPIIYGSNWILDTHHVTDSQASQIAAQLGASVYNGPTRTSNK